MTTSIMIVGVGGQGTLLASRIIGHLLMEKGYDVKVSEVHGMAQRGGSVITYVRYGERVNSPIISEGMADYVLAFEELEGYRWLSFAKKDAVVVVNTQQIMPMPVITGAAQYPQDLIDRLNATECKVTAVDALAWANEAGNSKAVNVALIGVLARKMPFAREEWEDALRACVPAKFLDLNLKAFALGYDGAAK